MTNKFKELAHRAKRSILYRFSRTGGHTLESNGKCALCNKRTIFYAKDDWLRDSYICIKCGSIPRERALMHVIGQVNPNWRDINIHESSPSLRGASQKLAGQCQGYTASQWDAGLELGTLHPDLGYRIENLERQTFEDESFDLVVTQDVLEHVFHPEKVFSEIARTLRSGGAHVFTVPIVRKWGKTQKRAALNATGAIEHYLPPQYHGNPIDPNGSLVTFDWGFDICELIYLSSGLITTIVKIDDLSLGIRGEYIEVFISRKLEV